jgi:8-oxo-dGTP diphosphatase
LTVDCVVFGINQRDSKPELQVLLVRRADDPFKGRWALPGGFVHVSDNGDQGESLEAAAQRELQEETAVEIEYLEQLYTFATPGRDPRGRVVSVAYYALVRTKDHTATAGSDAADVGWFNFIGSEGVRGRSSHEVFVHGDGNDPTLIGDPTGSWGTLAFDHADILRTALTRLQAKIRYTPIAFKLLPPKFTLVQLQRFYEAILMREIDRRNFYKRVKGFLVQCGVETNNSKPGPAAAIYRFDKRRYDAAIKRDFIFEPFEI